MLWVIFTLQSQRSLARACSASHQALEEIYEESQVPFVLVILGGFICQHNMNKHQIVCHQKPPGPVRVLEQILWLLLSTDTGRKHGHW